jgi:hypothetical protein
MDRGAEAGEAFDAIRPCRGTGGPRLAFIPPRSFCYVPRFPDAGLICSLV